MKSLFNLFALVLLLNASNLFSQLNDNWEWMNPKPQGNTLNAIDFVNDNIGYAAGAYGTMIKTTDNGVTWSKVITGTSTQFTALDFIDANTGYAGGSNQMLKKTVNGGNSWADLVLPSAPNYTVMDIKFINANTGYVLGFFILESRIWKTTDGGASWQTQTTGGANYLNNLYFLDEMNGFASGGSLGGEIAKTTNGGTTWQLVYQDNYKKLSMTFLNASTGFVGCAEGRVYKTVDGGNTWNFAYSDAGIDIMSIKFTDANNGFAFGTGSVYAKTTDGGNNWVEHPIGVGSIRQYYDGAITPNGTIQAAGTYGAMIRSTNGGASFLTDPFVTEEHISDIEFVNISTGYAVAGYSQGDILKTTDHGNTWVSQVSGFTLSIYGISFRNAETGYLAGSLKIYKTNNGGTNWQEIYTSTTNEIFTDVFFTNDNTGYVVGSYGRQLKTTNAGLNWTATTISNTGTILSSLYFVNDNTGYAVGDNNAAVKTTDAGVTWSVMSVAVPFENLNNIFFTDLNNGYIASNSHIFRTTNGGSTWFALPTPAGGYADVQFRGNFGYAISGNGNIIKSTDAGASWIVQPTVTNNGLSALYFNTDNFIYTGGLLGTMLRTMPAELILTPVSGNNNSAPKEYSLSQNYPNPFNPVTNIKFAIPSNVKGETSNVKLVIFDLLGRVVETLVNGMLTSGNYEVRWDASKYSSGIYFYSITTDEFHETKRMVLVK